jgi:hypothetical protein
MELIYLRTINLFHFQQQKSSICNNLHGPLHIMKQFNAKKYSLLLTICRNDWSRMTIIFFIDNTDNFDNFDNFEIDEKSAEKFKS